MLLTIPRTVGRWEVQEIALLLGDFEEEWKVLIRRFSNGDVEESVVLKNPDIKVSTTAPFWAAFWQQIADASDAGWELVQVVSSQRSSESVTSGWFKRPMIEGTAVAGNV
jgi:hypothetical protein